MRKESVERQDFPALSRHSSIEACKRFAKWKFEYICVDCKIPSLSLLSTFKSISQASAQANIKVLFEVQFRAEKSFKFLIKLMNLELELFTCLSQLF